MLTKFNASRMFTLLGMALSISSYDKDPVGIPPADNAGPGAPDSPRRPSMPRKSRTYVPAFMEITTAYTEPLPDLTPVGFPL
ncbi:hypothetical protein [Pedobacter sp. SYP-B3415]|uniref:hypothetical protein n=1 Tax=Pedobacter sp. SYP-B3415 TaxID=2496641 RepID=UPI00101BA3E5|nr:hypothetical protein [Pedobacter sp. SYP-B3415]